MNHKDKTHQEDSRTALNHIQNRHIVIKILKNLVVTETSVVSI